MGDANDVDNGRQNSGNSWYPRRRRLLRSVSPDTPVADVDDKGQTGTKALVLMSDEQRALLVWRMDNDRLIMARLKARGDEQRLWDRRWVRVGVLAGGFASFATVLYVVIQLLAALHAVTGR